MPAIANVRATLGAILLGCLLSVTLSGVVAAQSFLYWKLYPNDLMRVKLMVFLVWLLDAVHACLISSAAWDYLILNFGNPDILDEINMSVALTVALTALVTFVCHLFFSHRVLRLSKNNWWIAGPLLVLTWCRLAAAIVTTVAMTRDRKFTVFIQRFGWSFTTGLAISSALDILIAASLVYYLQTSRTGFGSSMDHVINVIMIHTFNNGALTCVTTIISMIMWLVMPNNLIFLGLHFAITKLYANSLLATLNTRKTLRGRSQHSGGSDHPMPVMFPSTFNRRNTSRFHTVSVPDAGATPTKLQISVEKTVQYAIDNHDRDRDRDLTISEHSP
ncbi:hypothetical protein DENSPDRAFT_629350 [Dentipellis sp. KUC8613]|nr:hypothetical protein DENSPDRAFT_629350 [Dentipellis sp. KUC8613]